MKVLVDFTQIPITRTGVGVYAENLVRELRFLITAEDVLFLLIQRDEAILRKLVAGHGNIKIIAISSAWFRHRALLFLFEQLLLPPLLLWYKIDVLHSLHYTHPLLSPCPRVVTIHDLTYLRFPELHTRARRLVMPFFIKHAMKRAGALIFVSDATRRDAESLMLVGNNLRKVVPLGVDLSDFIVTPESAGNILHELSISQPFLLFLGTIEPRKNVGRLIQAFESVADDFPELLLVIAGKLGWNFDSVLGKIEASKFSHRIRRLGFISDREKCHLLAGCTALVYPSLYEGFGLPVLEGMAAGAPVITSNISSLPEVAGKAALLVDPFSVGEISNAIRLVLSDSEGAHRMRVLGRQRAAEFDWKSVAVRTYDAYQSVASVKKPVLKIDWPSSPN